MRVSNVAPALAEEQAKALWTPRTAAYWKLLTKQWGNTASATRWVVLPAGAKYMNASLESYLKGYNDPRIKSYFNLAQDGRDKEGNIIKEVAGVKQLNSIEGEYKGVRQGTGVADNRYSTHSQTAITTGSKIIVMSAAEVWFLRAEAALRNYTSENVENCYKQGHHRLFRTMGCQRRQ